MTVTAQNNEQLMTRWIVEEYTPMGEESYWVPWVRPPCGPIYRFFSLLSTKREYDMYKQSFHYAPCKHRFVQVVIRPETIVNRIVEETHEE